MLNIFFNNANIHIGFFVFMVPVPNPIVFSENNPESGT